MPIRFGGDATGKSKISRKGEINPGFVKYNQRL